MKHSLLTIFGAFWILLFTIQVGKSESSTPGRSFHGNGFWNKLFTPINWKKTKQTAGNRVNDSSSNDKDDTDHGDNGNTKDMGQAVRTIKYDRAENERNAIPALNILDQSVLKKWHRLDDGVMGGQSETVHSCLDDGSLHFTGQINTNGGGFCSIRSSLPEGLPPDTTAISLRFKGDGKTYKLTLSGGTRSTFGPSKRSPSWQCDIPTKKRDACANHGEGEDEEIITIPLSSFKPSWGQRQASVSEQSAAVQLDTNSIREIGVMLSLKRSDGSSNPVETFGSGIFPFSLKISSIEPIAPTTGEETEK